MIANINIDIEKARRALKLSAGSMEEARIYENSTDEEIKDMIISHCKYWGITENNLDTEKIDFDILYEMARAASRYMWGKSITDEIDDTGKKHEVTTEDIDMAKKFFEFANYFCKKEEKVKEDCSCMIL